MRMKIQARLAQLTLLFLVLGCAGCATPHMRLYDGPARASAETAVLKIQWNPLGPSARIESINGKSLQKGRVFAVNLKQVELLPGTHTLEVSYFHGPASSINNATLTFTCKAGGLYELHAAPIDEGFGRAFSVAVGGRGHWTAWIIDAESQEILAGEPRTTALRWYER
jgi:hypothetical protein